MIRKPLVLFVLSIAFIIWQWIQPVKSPGIEMDLSLSKPIKEVEQGENSEVVIPQGDGRAGWDRDPFSLPPGVRQKSAMERSRQIHFEKKPMKVEGVLVSGSLKRVVIDDEILSIGDRLENWRVMDIQKDLVILETGDERVEIPISTNPLSLHKGI